MDDYNVIFLRQLREPSRFLFDVVTSVPWSYLDYFSYQVDNKHRCEAVTQPYTLAHLCAKLSKIKSTCLK